MNAILNGFLDSEYVKVMHCKSPKEAWELQKIYEGDVNVKQAKIETRRC